MEEILKSVNDFVWGIPALVLILGVGVYLTVLTNFAQIRLLPKALNQFRQMLLGGTANDSFKALCTALAATVGTGNIAGVAGAIALGGPGSIFWMWVCAFLGMVTKYAEAVLAVLYREKSASGELLAGPMYMIRQGMPRRFHWLGTAYCLFGCLAAFGVGNATQINAVVDSAASAAAFFGLRLTSGHNLLLGGMLGILAMWSLLGGGKRIGKCTSVLIPVASGAYILLCLLAILGRFDRIGQAFWKILSGAFCPRAVTGGLLGSSFAALRVGISRGVFTNEAGMGTAAIAHGTAQPQDPRDQGLMGITEVFLDTVVICTLTALVILTSGISIPYGLDEGAALTTRAFASVLGPWVSVAISLFLALFAFATILGWGFYGMRCVHYLLGERAEKPFVFLMLLGSFAGILLGTGPVWSLSETVNGLMAIPSLLVLAVLGPKAAQGTKNESARRRSREC